MFYYLNLGTRSHYIRRRPIFLFFYSLFRAHATRKRHKIKKTKYCHYIRCYIFTIHHQKATPQKSTHSAMSEQPNVDTTAMTTVYLSNLPFTASERDLHAFLSDYGATSVLIPTQTVRRFSKKRTDKPRKPLGIAFAQFTNATLALKAIQDLNGTTFQNQKLFLKMHVPYEAEPSPTPEAKKPKDKKKKKGKEAPDTAPDTVYCHDLPDDVTDSEIRELFQLYSPQEIWIYRSKVYKKRCIPLAPHQITAALVTLQSDKNIADICDDVGKAAALRGKPVIVKPAFVSKIQEIKQLVKDNLTNARDPPPTVAPAAPAAPAGLVHEVQNNNAGPSGIPPPPPSSSDAPALAAA